MSPCHTHTHLWPLGLHAPQAVGPVDDGVLRDHLVGVHVAAGPDDAAAGQDHVPANKRLPGRGRERNPCQRGARSSKISAGAKAPSRELPLDSMTLLSPTFIAWESAGLC